MSASGSDMNLGRKPTRAGSGPSAVFVDATFATFATMRLRAMDRGRRSAFTLIELLVVIAIIGLLIAILFPVLKSARSSAQVAGCASNLRQIGIGWNAYLVDFRETFPVTQKTWLGLGYGGKPHPLDPFDRPLNTYIPAEDLFRCPADQALVRKIDNEPKILTHYEENGNNYPGSTILLQTMFTDDDKFPARTVFDEIEAGIRRTEIAVSESRLLLAGDAQWYYVLNPTNKYSAHFHNDENIANILMLDGHVTFTALAPGLEGDDYVIPYFKHVPDRWKIPDADYNYFGNWP